MHFLNLSFSSFVRRGHWGQECQSSKIKIWVYGYLFLNLGKKYFLRISNLTPCGSGWHWWNHACEVATRMERPVSSPKASLGTSWFLGTGAFVSGFSKYSNLMSCIPPFRIWGSYLKRGCIICLVTLDERLFGCDIFVRDDTAFGSGSRTNENEKISKNKKEEYEDT